MFLMPFDIATAATNAARQRAREEREERVAEAIGEKLRAIISQPGGREFLERRVQREEEFSEDERALWLSAIWHCHMMLQAQGITPEQGRAGYHARRAQIEQALAEW